MEEQRTDIILKAIGQVESASNHICGNSKEAARDRYTLSRTTSTSISHDTVNVTSPVLISMLLV